MKLGIDVGGTFTDGVIIDKGRVARWAKIPTVRDDIRISIAGVLDQLLAGGIGDMVQRVVVSTTLVTNLLMSGNLERAAIVLIPGPGLDPDDMSLAPDQWIVKGGIDFRGREIEPIDPLDVGRVANEIKAKGLTRVAVVGKFCQRNAEQELAVGKYLSQVCPHFEILLGQDVSGELNYPRRAVTTFYTLAARQEWNRLAKQISEEMRARGINAPVHILKADGGTMSMDMANISPCETIFSGPAASTMGAYALTMDDRTSVVLDVGGTTSDLAFILQGKPLHASRGARIGGKYTHIRSLAVRSVAVGGDSAVRLDKEGLHIGPDRLGNAACFGGSVPTPTDAFNVLTNGSMGNLEDSVWALASLSNGDTHQVDQVARDITDLFVKILHENVISMMHEWEDEPAYKVWEIVNRRQVEVERVIGIGAAVPQVIPMLASRMGCEGLISPLSAIGNALGAAVARPTSLVRLHADTGMSSLTVNGSARRHEYKSGFRLSDAKAMAEEELQQIVEAEGMGEYFVDREFVLEEQFNVVSNWMTVGRIFDVSVVISPGVVDDFEGVQE